MEEINKTGCHGGKCSEILKIWWVKSLLGFFIFLLIFWMGVLFGQSEAIGHREMNNFPDRQMPSQQMRAGSRVRECQCAPTGQIDEQKGQESYQQQVPAASQIPTGTQTAPQTGTNPQEQGNANPTAPTAPAGTEIK